MLSLFSKYPGLEKRIPHYKLGDYPTPVGKLSTLSSELKVENLYVKRDDLSGEPYSGNKVRKLEFIYANILAKKIKGIFVFGYGGSNFVVAANIYAKKLGIKCLTFLVSQVNANYVRKNLLVGTYYKAKIFHYSNYFTMTLGSIYYYLSFALKNRSLPQLASFGGSSAIGTVGFVNAAFELKEQIKNGDLPEPDFIYVALGSMGTAAGLILGAKAAGLKSKIIPVRVVMKAYTNEKTLNKLILKTNKYLHKLDDNFPLFPIEAFNYEIRHDAYGKGYAYFTSEGQEAVKLLREKEDIKLEGTYSGKAFAALIKSARNDSLKDKVVLFWNTQNSVRFEDQISKLDYHELPKSCHQYFDNEVQELDR